MPQVWLMVLCSFTLACMYDISVASVLQVKLHLWKKSRLWLKVIISFHLDLVERVQMSLVIIAIEFS